VNNEDWKGDHPSLSLTKERPEFIVEIFGDDNERLVSLRYDGTVIVHKEGSEPEAARRFWDAIGVEGYRYAELRKRDGAEV